MSEVAEETIVFECDGDRLVGIIHRPGEPHERLGILIVVGGPQYRVGSHRQFVLMARDLASAGYPVMRFDYRGLGDADGEPRNFESIDADLNAAIGAFQRSVPALTGLVLWGLCDAASAIMMTPMPPSVKGKVVVNPWVRTPSSEAQVQLRRYYLQRLLQAEFWRKISRGSLDWRGAVRQFHEAVRRAFAPSARSAGENVVFIHRMLAEARIFKGLTLVILSGNDLTAQEFELLCANSPAWKDLLNAASVHCVRIPGADHTFSARPMLDAGTRTTLGWIENIKALSA